MNENELRIGNLLQDGISKAVLVVCKIEIGIITTIVKDRDKYPLANGWYQEPILLTEEWLLKFGAVKRFASEWDYHLSIGAIKIYFRFNIKWYCKLEGIYLDDKIQFVHQLQNLFFDLKGTELVPN